MIRTSLFEGKKIATTLPICRLYCQFSFATLTSPLEMDPTRELASIAQFCVGQLLLEKTVLECHCVFPASEAFQPLMRGLRSTLLFF